MYSTILFNGVSIYAVSQPNITQDCNSSSCTLTCKATEDEHSQYTWTDSRGERKDGPVWTVENRAEDQGVTYTCNVSNPVSWKIGTFTVPGRIAYDAVSQPNITQVCNSSSCTLSCKAKEDEHSQYTWTDSRGERKDGPVWTVEKRAEDQGVTYTCNVSNPVSWAIGTFPVPGRIAYGKIFGIGSAVLVLIGIGIGIFCCWKRKTCIWNLSTPGTEELSCSGNRTDATAENGDAVGIKRSELQELLGQTRDASNRVHGHATNAENGDASHEVVINLHELSCSGNRTDATAENGDVTPDLTSQQDTKEEVPKLETSEVDVDYGETPDDANAPFFDKNVI
ncbi:uncharacterized protein LOC122133331 [Clupea harengus]|uniref:Uncharacterized protein LOC122133331 n=1 Tax=Clupea harengus TaxID=7950 RepID=A0A8M1KMF6_CLUHA|nr:uncharacterized protein LOC122133331 [Clupea harengus]